MRSHVAKGLQQRSSFKMGLKCLRGSMYALNSSLSSFPKGGEDEAARLD
jgi:hypothetical protein